MPEDTKLSIPRTIELPEADNALIARAAQLVRDSRAIASVTDQFELELCATQARELADAGKALDAAHSAQKRPVIDIGRLIDSAYKAVTDPIDAERRRLNTISASYLETQRRAAEQARQEAERKRREEEARVRAEVAAKEKAAAEARAAEERARVQREEAARAEEAARVRAQIAASRGDEDAQRKAAEAAEAAARAREAADAEMAASQQIGATAAAEAQAAVLEAAVMPASAAVEIRDDKGAAKDAGLGIVHKYSAEVKDLGELIRAAAERPDDFAEFLMPNQKALDKFAAARKDRFRVPGCELVKDSTVKLAARRG